MPSTPPIKVPILGEDKYSKEFMKMARSAEKMGQKVGALGKRMTMGLTAPIVATGVASVAMSKKLNESMANVGTLIPGQTEELKKFREEVVKLGIDTATNFDVVAEGLYETISAFGSAEDPMNKLTLSAKMAKAGLSTVKESLQLVSAVTKGYGDTSDQAAQSVADMSFLTVKLGQTTFPELAVSIGKAVPLFTTLKIKQDELFGSMAALTGVTGNAAEVSTQLRSAAGAFITPSEKMTEAAKKMGFASSVAMVQELGLSKSISRLSEEVGGSEIAMGKLFTRKEGLNAVLTLLGPQAKNFAEKTAAMGMAAGATDDAFKQQTEGINKTGFAFDQGVIKIKAFMVQIGDKLMPTVGRLIDKLQPLMDSMAGVSEETLEMGIKIAAGVATAGPLLMFIGASTKAIAGLLLVIKGAGGLTSVSAGASPMLWLLGKSKLAIMAYTAKLKMATAATQTFTIYANKGTAAQTVLATKTRMLNRDLATQVKRMGALGTAMSLVGAAAAGWTIGTIIYDQLVKPLQDSLRLMKKADDELKALDKYGTKNMSVKAMEQTEASIKAAIQEEKAAIKDLNAQTMARGGFKGLIKTSAKLREYTKALEEVQYGASEERTAAKMREEAKEGKIRGGFSGQDDFDFDMRLLENMAGMGKSEQEITVKFDGLPEGVTATVTKTKGKAKVKDKGAVLAGAF